MCPKVTPQKPIPPCSSVDSHWENKHYISDPLGTRSSLSAPRSLPTSPNLPAGMKSIMSIFGGTTEEEGPTQSPDAGIRYLNRGARQLQRVG